MHKHILLILFILSGIAHSQERTIGLLLDTEEALEGYTLFAPIRYRTTYLINNEGNLIHSWTHERTPAMSVRLLENGNLLRTTSIELRNNRFSNIGGAGGGVHEIDWDGNIVWEFEYADDDYLLHHDIEKMPNGNVLMIAWEYKSEAEAIQAGRDPDLIWEGMMWPDHIIEVEPTGEQGGEIVWEWHIFDHVIQDYDSTKDNYGVVEEHPELLDINFHPVVGHGRNADWNHMNSLDYHEEFDQILMTNHGSAEILIIDHSATTEEAAGHEGGRYGKGGDILYRWGNPMAYRVGDEDDQRFAGIHDAHWIEEGLDGAGNIMVFNNGTGREDEFSSVDVIEPPVDDEGNYYLEDGHAFGPGLPSWSYTADNPMDFYSPALSGAQRLSNGNTLICEGQSGNFFEINADDEIIWRYKNPVNIRGPQMQGTEISGNGVFRCIRYEPDFAGFDGKELIAGDPIELYPGYVESSSAQPVLFGISSIYPNPFNSTTTITYGLDKSAPTRLMIYDLSGREVRMLHDGYRQAGFYSVNLNASDLASGIYFVKLEDSKQIVIRKLMLIK